jgi:hypothetical protein
LGSFVLWFLRWCDTIYIWQTPPLQWWGVTGIYVAVLILLFRKELTLFVSQQYRALRQRPN